MNCKVSEMHCIRCGRELPLGQVFCKECLADMATHPVKAGTPVILPPPPAPVVNRRPARKTRKPEEQLSRLRRVMISMLVLFSIIILAGTMLIYSLSEKIDTLEQTIVSMTEEQN